MNHSRPKYDREIRAEGSDSLSRIAAIIEAGSQVLDLGAGVGALGDYLTTQKSCTVDGVELDPASVAASRAAYRTLIEGDILALDLSAAFGSVHYDYIVCADLIEHLPQPKHLLNKLKPLMGQNCKLLLSVPNISYLGAIAEILQGRFTYRDTGIFDETHLRFFTADSLGRLLAQSRYRVERAERVELALGDSEFDSELLNQLPTALSRQIRSIPEYQTYQFICEARLLGVQEAPPDPANNMPLGPESDIAKQFPTQLFWRLGPHSFFLLENSSVGWACKSDQRQRVAFQIPECDQPITGIRFDPSDRKGQQRFYGYRIYPASGGDCIAGTLDIDRVYEQGLCGDVVITSCEQNACSVLALGNDPWFEIPMPEEQLALLPGSRLEIDLSWPEPQDFTPILKRLDGFKSNMNRTHEALRKAAFDRACHEEEASLLYINLHLNRGQIEAKDAEINTLRKALTEKDKLLQSRWRARIRRRLPFLN